jgi:hypothetical protein
VNLDFEKGTYYDEKPEMIGTPSSSWVSDDFGVITLCSDKPMNKSTGDYRSIPKKVRLEVFGS